MTKIVITIEVDGSNVTVSSTGAKPASSSKPFTPRPDPEYPDWDPQCAVHGVDWKLIPAGTSKTAKNEDGSPKRYNAFYACPERGCNEKPAWKPDESVEEMGF